MLPISMCVLVQSMRNAYFWAFCRLTEIQTHRCGSVDAAVLLGSHPSMHVHPWTGVMWVPMGLQPVAMQTCAAARAGSLAAWDIPTMSLNCL